tara:strand:+ start:1884 stop:2072 length:189 start_codon:yes stop_codon:yes gene_type:complete
MPYYQNDTQILERLNKLPHHILVDLHSRFTEPFSMSVVEFGEQILAKQVEEDTTTFTNFKGE